MWGRDFQRRVPGETSAFLNSGLSLGANTCKRCMRTPPWVHLCQCGWFSALPVTCTMSFRGSTWKALWHYILNHEFTHRVWTLASYLLSTHQFQILLSALGIQQTRHLGFWLYGAFSIMGKKGIKQIIADVKCYRGEGRLLWRSGTDRWAWMGLGRKLLQTLPLRQKPEGWSRVLGNGSTTV